MTLKWRGDTAQVKESLLERLAPEQVLIKGLEPFGADTSSDINGRPDIVVFALRNDDVQWVCKTATRFKIPITVRGAGTGNTGAAVPIFGGIVLSLEKMNQILDLDLGNKMMVVQAGAITGEIQKQAEAQGLFYPPDPQSAATCTIGGNIAQNAGGPRAVKYGVTGHYVLGLTGFLIDGTPFTYGGKQVKNVAGYNLMQLLIGSEGTLGIVTEITLKLRTKPNISQDALLLFSNYEDAVATLTDLHTQHLEPSKVEFIDGFCFEAVAKQTKIENNYQSSPASLLIECDGYSENEVDQMMDHIHRIATNHHLKEYKCFKTPEENAQIWDMRMNFSTA